MTDKEKTPGVFSSGTVREVLPRALYRVRMDSGHEITAHAPGGAGRNFVRLVVGDRVRIELAAKDVTRGRIVKRL
jgi:translation initiation factor IF-1